MIFQRRHLPRAVPRVAKPVCGSRSPAQKFLEELCGSWASRAGQRPFQHRSKNRPETWSWSMNCVLEIRVILGEPLRTLGRAGVEG